MQITMDKGPLLDVLRDNLAKAKAEDARLKKSHEADEQKALGEFHAKCRAALKWTYKEAKKRGFEIGDRYRDGAPECPRANAPQIQRIIDQVRLAKAPSHSFNADSDVGQAVYWRPEAERLKESLCD